MAKTNKIVLLLLSKPQIDYILSKANQLSILLTSDLMNFELLQQKFTQGLNWNGFLYLIYKVLATLLSFVLYSILTTQDFSLWANINSMVFLTLLWIDCGFRKSLPRYCPEFAHTKNSQRRFISTVISTQITILLIAIPFFMLAQRAFLPTSSYKIYYLGALLLTTEGVIAILRLIYHSHFWIKQFNLLNTTTIIIEMALNYVLIMTINPLSLTSALIINKVCLGITTIGASLIMLKHLYKDMEYREEKTVNYADLFQGFIKHSAIMWVNNALKSLTERNFMVPLLTHVVGPAQANMFKVANDGALLFYRSIIKTIGTTDTSLFTYAGQLTDAKKLVPIAFKKLMSSIAALCLPLSGILMLLIVLNNRLFNDRFVFHLFIIITIAYLIESILSPYERILEVKRCYVQLFLAYTPYIIMISTMLIFNIIPLIGLVKSILVIHGVRLVSSLLMIPYAQKEYMLPFPIKFITTLFVCCPIIWLYFYYCSDWLIHYT